jgi:hypothetical protein
MSRFNNGQPYHGEATRGGKLKGSTDTDYFYFFCPDCGEDNVLQIIDFTVSADGPVKYDPAHRRKAKRDFVIAFHLLCSTCGLEDFVKVSNIGWQGGPLRNSPALSYPLVAR